MEISGTKYMTMNWLEAFFFFLIAPHTLWAYTWFGAQVLGMCARDGWNLGQLCANKFPTHCFITPVPWLEAPKCRIASFSTF